MHDPSSSRMLVTRKCAAPKWAKNRGLVYLNHSPLIWRLLSNPNPNTSKVPTDHSQFMGPSVCLNRRLHQPGKNFPTSKMDLYQHEYHPILIYSTEKSHLKKKRKKAMTWSQGGILIPSAGKKIICNFLDWCFDSTSKVQPGANLARERSQMPHYWARRKESIEQNLPFPRGVVISLVHFCFRKDGRCWIPNAGHSIVKRCSKTYFSTPQLREESHHISIWIIAPSINHSPIIKT